MAAGSSRTVDERVFRLALEKWVEWLLLLHAPRPGGHRAGDGNGPRVDVWDVVCKRARSNTEHTDSVLGGLMAEERRHWDWPASIHAAIMDMPGTHQLVLLGTALDVPQAQIGEAIGLRQQLVSSVLVCARQTLTIRIYLLARTDQMCRKILGLGAPMERRACALGRI